jgi:hypothetical protein
MSGVVLEQSWGDIAGLLSGAGADQVRVLLSPSPEPALTLACGRRELRVAGCGSLGGESVALSVRTEDIVEVLQSLGTGVSRCTVVWNPGSGADTMNLLVLSAPDGRRWEMVRTDLHVIPRRTIEQFCREVLAAVAAKGAVDPEDLRELPGDGGLAEALDDHEHCGLNLRDLGLPRPPGLGWDAGNGVWAAPARQVIHYLMHAAVQHGHPFGEAMRPVIEFLTIDEDDPESPADPPCDMDAVAARLGESL